MIKPNAACMLTCNIKGSKTIKILKRDFKSRQHIQKENHGAYFEIPAILASSLTLTVSGKRKSFCNFLRLFRQMTYEHQKVKMTKAII